MNRLTHHLRLVVDSVPSLGSATPAHPESAVMEGESGIQELLPGWPDSCEDIETDPRERPVSRIHAKGNQEVFGSSNSGRWKGPGNDHGAP